MLVRISHCTDRKIAERGILHLPATDKQMAIYYTQTDRQTDITKLCCTDKTIATLNGVKLAVNK